MKGVNTTFRNIALSAFEPIFAVGIKTVTSTIANIHDENLSNFLTKA